MDRTRRSVGAFVAACLLAPAGAPAQPYGSPGALTDAGVTGGALGQSVSISTDGTVAVVGQPNAAGGAGAALVYANADGAWTFVQRLQPTGEVGLGHFGAAVSIEPAGQEVIVGAPDDNGTGAAYVFARSGGVWTQQAGALVPHGAMAGAKIGASVALANSGLVALVGAPMWSVGGGIGRVGEAFTFYYGDDPWAPGTTDWYPHQRMGAGTDPLILNVGAHFGASVALSSNGGSAVVGAPDADPGGKVFLFGHFYTDENWLNSGSIAAPASAAGFGATIVMSPASDELIIGAPLAQNGAGAAYQYASNGTLEQRIDDPSPSAGGHFGTSVAAAYAGELLVGAPGENAGAGAVYAFDAALGGAWVPSGAPLGPLSEPAAGDAYGTSVAVSADRSDVLVGAPGSSAGDGAVSHFVAAPIATPDPPVSVHAVAGIEAADVSWTAPPSDGGSPITTYTATSAPDGLTCTAPAPTMQCTVVGLTAGKAYAFTVTATNYAGTGGPSTPSGAVTPASQPDTGGGGGGGSPGDGSGGTSTTSGGIGGTTGTGTTGGGSAGGGSGPGSGGAGPGGTLVRGDTTAPTRPPGSLKVSKRTRTSITVSWGPAHDDRGVAGYRVYASLGGTWKQVGSTTALKRTFVRARLRHRTRHRLAVRAYDVAGNLSLPLIGPWVTTR